ncbi:transmembrane protein 6/97 [Collybia nuda]|uniref:Efficient mitochondria targeting-associated protein 19 n=1 Tax=Collybia nuda TaxID=64659 RepID=A0A9P5Y5C5_9AGAR|nr:transmembrane protein 6/97 [Collybia nuda]
MSSGIPSSSRPQDKFYILFLMSFIPTIVFVDCIAIYPASIVPGPLLSLHEFYKATFNDQLVINQPPWFRLFSLVEFLYQLPVAVWAVWALKNKSPKVPATLLVWATVAFGTTMTCLFEFYHNEVMSSQEKSSLIAMYGCYGLLFGAIAADMFCRIQKILSAVAKLSATQKTR